MSDPYALLGLRRTASAEEIKRSYRRLAKKLHPDVNPGNQRIEQQFKNVSAAYELLSDPVKRARYDRGEIDEAGVERGVRYPGSAGGRAAPQGDDIFVDDFMSDLFRGQRSGSTKRGGDAGFRLQVPFLEAVLGAKKRVAMGDGKTLDVVVPTGIEDGRTLRLKGQGNAGLGGGPAGDALIDIAVEPHSVFSRHGADIRATLAVSLPEAVLGGRVTAPTVHGPVSLKVPPGSNTGTVLRLRGKGVPQHGTTAAGDHYVTLQVVLPDPPDADLIRFIESWSRSHPYDVRERVETA